MHVQFSSVILICPWESNSQTGQMLSHSHQWFWSTQILETWSNSHSADKISDILISGSDLLKHWRVTYLLDLCVQSVVFICSNTGEWLTRWMHVQPFLSAFLICSNIADQLTCWMCVQPFLLAILICSYARVTHMLDVCVQPFSSVVLISSNTEEVSLSDSHAKCMFSHSC